MGEQTYLNIHRPDQAAEKLCFQPHIKTCVGPECMAWRWADLFCTKEWVAAVQQRADETGEKGAKPKAARYVNENREKYGLPLKPFNGYCGLAGGPG